MPPPKKPPNPQETQLIQRIKNGDTQAFEPLIKKYQPRLFATARKYTRNETDTQDIVQNIFIKTYKHIHTYRAQAPFEHWLMRIAIRTCYDHLRTQQKNRETNLTQLTHNHTTLLDHYLQTPQPDTHTTNAIRTLIHQILQQLPPPARLIITLQEIEGKTIKQIAQQTGWSQSLIKVRAHRARKQMKKLLEKIDTTRYL